MNKNMNVLTHQVFPDLSGEIIQIVRSNLAPRTLQERIGAYHEKDVALTLPMLSREERQKLFRILPARILAGILEYAEEDENYLEGMSVRQKAEVLSCMEAASVAALMQQMPREERGALMDWMPEAFRKELSLIRSFEEDEIGSRMSTNYIAIPDSATVKEAMSELVRQAAENDNIATLYLVDDGGSFCGAIDLKELIIAREGTPLSEITTLSYPYLYARMTVEDCIPFLREYSETSIPVLDDQSRLVGVVTAQDFAEILDEEMNEDYARLGGLSSEEDLEEPVVQSVRKRLPWLCILLLLGLGVSAVVGMFESIVAQLPVIMCFQSLILDMAGNVGTQSLAVAIRVLMDTQIGRRHKAALVWKEARVGLLNGCLLGTLSFGAIGAYLCLTGSTPMFAFAVSGCLGIAMMLAMLVSALSGTLIPIFFKRVGVDPAVASGPLITTVNDLVAVVSYYGLAWLILLNILHLA